MSGIEIHKSVMVQFAFQASMKHTAGAVPCHQQFCKHAQCASFREESSRFTNAEGGMKHHKLMLRYVFYVVKQIYLSSLSTCEGRRVRRPSISVNSR
jgi:hypothetical protein